MRTADRLALCRPNVTTAYCTNSPGEREHAPVQPEYTASESFQALLLPICCARFCPLPKHRRSLLVHLTHAPSSFWQAGYVGQVGGAPATSTSAAGRLDEDRCQVFSLVGTTRRDNHQIQAGPGDQDLARWLERLRLAWPDSEPAFVPFGLRARLRSVEAVMRIFCSMAARQLAAGRHTLFVPMLNALRF
jgi:hypothetical protein